MRVPAERLPEDNTATSRWRIDLPFPGLPLRALLCKTDAPVFERRVRIYEEAPDARGRFQDPRSRKIAEPKGQQTVPDSADHVRAGEERVQTRALKRLPLAVIHQGAKAVSALDPGLVLRPVSA